jgi:NADH-quinone oxidoreductase subunit M
MPFPVLPAIKLLPTAGALVILFIPAARKNVIRIAALLSTGASFALAASLLFLYDKQAGGFQFITRIPWVETLGISYHVGVDGIGVVMLLLTTAVIFAGVFVSWSIEDLVKEHYILLLILVTGVLGVFMTLDLLFFYLFYELSVATRKSTPQ